MVKNYRLHLWLGKEFSHTQQVGSRYRNLSFQAPLNAGFPSRRREVTGTHAGRGPFQGNRRAIKLITLWMMLSDRAATRAAIRRLRSTAGPVAFLGEFPDSATGLGALSRLQPDGILLDTGGRFGRGAEWKSSCGTQSEFTAWRWSAINHWEPGYANTRVSFSVLRPFQAPELAEWNRQLRATGAWTPHTTACQQLASAPQRPAKPARPLSDRERTILKLLASGRTYQEISDRLTISKSSIYAYMARIYKQFLPQFRRPSIQSKRRLLVKLLPRGD